MGIPPFFKGSVRERSAMSTCVHFSTFSGTIFTVGTRGRMRFAAIFLFWTYCISQGMVRVCPFTNLLIGPWLEFEPSTIEQFGPNAERFTDVWALTYFCMATCSLLAIYRLMEANFQQYFCWVADFIFQPVVMQDCGELQRSSVVHALHDWFCAFGNCHIFCTLQTGSVIFPWSQTSRELGINSVSCQPTDSGSIAIVGLYRTIYEWGTTHCVVLLRSWFDFHSTYCQFVRHDSGRFLAQLQLRCRISLPMLGHFAGTVSLFSFTVDSIVDKVFYMDCFSPLLHFDTTTGRTVLQLTALGVFMPHELPVSRWSKPWTGLSREYGRVPWTWRGFICK